MKTNTVIQAHILIAAESFRRGEKVYYAESGKGESVALFHRKLWRLAHNQGHAWKFRRDGLRVEIKARGER